MRPERHVETRIGLTARGAATRARIVSAAAELVAVNGVAGTSLDAVMAASETSKSQVYHYFGNKDELMCAVVEAQASKVIDFQGSCLKSVRSLADLRKWRDTVVKLNRAGGGVGSLASELSDRSEAARTLLAKSFRTWESHLAGAFEAMVGAGELDAAVDKSVLATAVLGALQGGLLLAQTARSTKPLELSLDMALSHVERYATGFSCNDSSRSKPATTAARTRRRSLSKRGP
jgi:TetR/AcrR family transcriptional regulator, transcriptional repressor for nem operon